MAHSAGEARQRPSESQLFNYSTRIAGSDHAGWDVPCDDAACSDNRVIADGNTFQHGGVSLEEMIVPVIKMQSK